MFEEYDVVGFREVNFNDKDGKEISGTTLFLERDNPDVEGIETLKQFLPSRIEYIPHVGDHIQLVYNRYGKIAQVICS